MGAFTQAGLGQGIAQAGSGFSEAIMALMNQKLRERRALDQRRRQMIEDRRADERLDMAQDRIALARAREDRLQGSAETRDRLRRWETATGGEPVPPDLLSREPAEVARETEGSFMVGPAGTPLEVPEAGQIARRAGSIGARIADYGRQLGAGDAVEGNRVALRGYEIPFDPVEQPDQYRQAVESVESPVYEHRRGAAGEGGGGGGAEPAADVPEMSMSRAMGLVEEATSSENVFGDVEYKIPPGERQRLANRLVQGDTTAYAELDSLAAPPAPADTASPPAQVTKEKGGGLLDGIMGLFGLGDDEAEAAPERAPVPEGGETPPDSGPTAGNRRPDASGRLQGPPVEPGGRVAHRDSVYEGEPGTYSTGGTLTPGVLQAARERVAGLRADSARTLLERADFTPEQIQEILSGL